MTEKDARRSHHDVYRVTASGFDSTPCFCTANSIHPVGQEQSWSEADPAIPPGKELGNE